MPTKPSSSPTEDSELPKLAQYLGRDKRSSCLVLKELKEEVVSLSIGISWLGHCVLPIVDVGYNPVVIMLLSPNFLCFIFLSPFVFYIKEKKTPLTEARRVDMIQHNIF